VERIVVELGPSCGATIIGARPGPGRAEAVLGAAGVGPGDAVVVVGDESSGTGRRIVVGDTANPFTAGAQAASAIADAGRVVVLATLGLRGRPRRQFLDALVLGSAKPTLREVVIVAAAPAVPALRRQLIGLAGVLQARRLANLPAAAKPPPALAEQIVRLALAAGVPGEVLDEQALARIGAGGILAVGGGSATPPRLVVLRHRPAGARRHVVLVGKGITFDSGGLSLKSAAGMTMMRTDMSGAATVAATVATAARLRLPVALTAYLPLAENAVSGSAMRPGDVVRHVGGRTSEVRNTDAEGRLVLADALALAARRERCDAVVDVATLTGAATLALSRRVGAVLSHDDALAAALVSAGARSCDPLWRLPLVPEYAQAIASDVADAANSTTDPTNLSGAITAAWFLEPFAAGRWAHVDIAGPARAETARDGQPKGATGYGVRLLLAWLQAVARGRGW
jgi:leucyl aminopeptidase